VIDLDSNPSGGILTLESIQLESIRYTQTGRRMDSGMRFSVLILSYTITLQSSHMEQPPDKTTRCIARSLARSAFSSARF
jgi:hypothetical protein